MGGQSRRKFTGAALIAALFAPWRRSGAEEPGAPDGPGLTLKELSGQLGLLQNKYETLVQAFNAHAVLDPPDGSIVAYGGLWPPINPANGEPRTEDDIGWALCDGRSFTDPSLEKIKASLESGLRIVLGAKGRLATSLPDLRGHFLRGIDGTYAEPAQMRDKAGVREPLATQDFLTAFPKNAFTAVEVPDHTHDTQFEVSASRNFHGGANNTVADQRDKIGGHATSPAGHHTHVISGGDAETRPVNVAVHYIIKFRSAPRP